MKVPHQEPSGIAPAEAPADQLRVRLRIWNEDGTHCLANGESLPALMLRRSTLTDPEAVARAVRAALGVDTILLRHSESDLIEVDCRSSDTPLPSGYEWSRAVMTPAVDVRVPWQRPGWFTTTIAEVDEALGAIDIRRLGRPIHVRNTSVTGMLRVDTDAGPMWLKSVPSLFAHEAPVVRWLAALGFSVPDVVASTQEWWLAREFAAGAGNSIGDPLAELARAQVASAARQAELSAIGCPLRPITALADELSVLRSRPDLLAADDVQCLSDCLPRIACLCAEASALDFPDTLVHGDLSPGNVRWTGTSWLIFDWTDACISHPFVDLASPLSYEAGEAGSRIEAFAAVWAQQMPHGAVERALRLAPVFGAAHQAATYLRIISGVESTAADQAGGERLTVFLRYWLRRAMSALPA